MRPFLPQTEKITEKIQVWLNASIRFANMDESGNEEDRVWVQVTNPNLIIEE